jgi:hypothetical protein
MIELIVSPIEPESGAMVDVVVVADRGSEVAGRGVVVVTEGVPVDTTDADVVGAEPAGRAGVVTGSEFLIARSTPELTAADIRVAS